MQGKRAMRTAIGVAVTVAVLGSACAKKSITPGAGGTTPAATGSGGGGGYGDYGRGGGSGASSSPSAPGTGTVVQQGVGGQLVFSPARLSVKQGATLTISNVSTDKEHTFTITGKGIDITNTPGQSQSVAINLAPGTYTFICRFHQSFGMMGTLTVTG
jgi:plastocyanin